MKFTVTRVLTSAVLFALISGAIAQTRFGADGGERANGSSAQARRSQIDAAAARAEADTLAERRGVLDKAAGQAHPAKINLPASVAPQAGLIDPEKIARQYSEIKAPEKREEETNELMVFVSMSMPKGSLERAAVDTRTSGGMLVMRGASRGVGPGKWTASLADLKPMTDKGGEVFMHPDLFERYGIKKVPAMVIAPDAQAGCTDDACREFAVIYGDVSLDYALEQLTDRKDTIGSIARARLARIEKKN